MPIFQFRFSDDFTGSYQVVQAWCTVCSRTFSLSTGSRAVHMDTNNIQKFHCYGVYWNSPHIFLTKSLQLYSVMRVYTCNFPCCFSSSEILSFYGCERVNQLRMWLVHILTKEKNRDRELQPIQEVRGSLTSSTWKKNTLGTRLIKLQHKV